MAETARLQRPGVPRARQHRANKPQPRPRPASDRATEALAALYEASGDEAVLARLLEMLRIICEKMVTKDNVMYGGSRLQ